MKEISDYVNGLELGQAQIYKNIAVIPLMGKDSKLEYIVFDEAVNSGLKVNETGSVPTLHMKNETGKEVLIMLGEYVKGGKQNRMVATNVYMAKDFDGDVPVSCVQHFRWTPGMGSDFGSSGRRATRDVSYAACRGQDAVWNMVSCLAADTGISSLSQDIGDVYEGKKQDVGDYLRNFSYIPNSVGLVVITQKNGLKDFTADIFDQSRTLEKNYRKLIESYVLEALSGGNNVQYSEQEIKEFLDKLKDAGFTERKPVSLGRDFLIQGNNIEGSSIVYEGIPVYITLGNRTKKHEEPITPENPFPGLGGHIRTGFYRPEHTTFFNTTDDSNILRNRSFDITDDSNSLRFRF